MKFFLKDDKASNNMLWFILGMVFAAAALKIYKPFVYLFILIGLIRIFPYLKKIYFGGK